MHGAYATEEATKTYSARYPAGFYRDAQGLTVSSLGIGTYLGNMDEATDRGYEEAVMLAVESGINFIDTSMNYRHGRSERNIGAALNRVSASRDELVVCTKAGYLVRGAAPDLDPNDVAGGNHSMAPAFLVDQIGRSRSNLQLSTLDVLYLHNPESQLEHISRTEFDSRLRSAFRTLEELRAAGTIRFYGAATWSGFRMPGLLSLDRMLELAAEVGGQSHGFRFIQLPFNLAMREAYQSGITRRANEQGVTVVTSASIRQSKLASGMKDQLRNLIAPAATDAQCAIQFARSAPGVTVSLVGMSRREHVMENLGVAAQPAMDRESFVSLVERLEA